MAVTAVVQAEWARYCLDAAKLEESCVVSQYNCAPPVKPQKKKKKTCCMHACNAQMSAWWLILVVPPPGLACSAAFRCQDSACDGFVAQYALDCVWCAAYQTTPVVVYCWAALLCMTAHSCYIDSKGQRQRWQGSLILVVAGTAAQNTPCNDELRWHSIVEADCLRQFFIIEH
jgi:hypothetical protein